MGNYVSPVAAGTRTMREDQGQDYQGTPGQPVVAIGNATVDAVKKDPGGFGRVVYYTLQDGPYAGQQIYVGHAQPTVKPGQHVNAGDPVATLLEKPLGNATGPGWAEIGLAKGGQPEYGMSDGGANFQRLIRNAAASKALLTDPAANPAAPVPVAAPAQAPAGLALPVPVVPPSTPDVPQAAAAVALPGSVTILPHQTAQLWQQVATQDMMISPDTQALFKNAQLAAGPLS